MLQKETSMLTFEAQGTQGSAAIVEKLQVQTGLPRKIEWS